MPDFFVSYTSADRLWAEWIAFQLEEAGFSTIIQAWDFRPGSNFVIEMQKAASEADRTIMVISSDYLKSQFTSPEWAAAFVHDPQGIERKLLPVVVRMCSIPGLLKSVVYIDLTEVDERNAKQRLLDGVNAKRAKPQQRPNFPGVATRQEHKPFPGAVGSGEVRKASPHMPKLKSTLSDADRRRFSRRAFAEIYAHFEAGLKHLSESNEAIDCDFQPNSATDFEAEIFLGGKAICRCRVWMGGVLSRDGIAYNEGQAHNKDACNEILSIEPSGDELCLRALFGNFTQLEKEFDLKRLSDEEAAEYLWRRFIAPLER